MCYSGKIIYNSKEKAYKNPFGALKTEAECSFCIDIDKENTPDEVFFSYRQDESSIFTKIKMQKSNETENYVRYSCKASFSDCGLYFYRFELSSENGTYIFGKDNLCSEWQLTVYYKDFKTPEWAKGGIMYQIFPDRFCHSDNYMQRNAKNERKIHKSWYDAPDFIYDNPEYKGNDFFCGNLDGIIEKIGY